ncbi:MAG TPA: decaprenyl-phosphate phosphoribosyltransferase [Solirubrobacteraceae bacterium]|jgi:decaprenyl-phosphate phosphoribosyltransferase
MSASDQLLPALSRRRRANAAVLTARPRQWVKNALVIAAAGAAGALGRDDVPLRVGLAAVAFCLLSSGIYALNDVRDAAEDRLHPRKRFRPVAAGELTPRDAVLLGVCCLTAGLVLCVAVRPLLVLVGAGYVALTLSYTWLWRRILVLDIVAIAGGFVVRAVAGGVAAPVELSRWFVLVVTGASLFVAAGKRHAELLRTARLATQTPRGDRPPASPAARGVIHRYTPGLLGLLLAGSGAVALFAYWVWAFALPDVDGVPWRMLTAVPFSVGLLRYAALVREGAGEAPEETLLSDRILVLVGIIWLVLFALTVHATG